MAKRNQRSDKDPTVLTYKEQARARRETKIRRQTLIAVGVLASIVLVILVFALVSELIVKPGQPVALVNGTEITTKQFQERVRLERAQTINLIYQYADMLGVEQVSGVAAQLDDYEAVGEQVLNTMTDELLVRQGATALGVVLLPEEVDREFEVQAGYYRDGTPTPLPTSTPRPSPTPISPTETVATPIPSITPMPTPTVVTAEGFGQLYKDRVQDLKRNGVSETTFRDWVEYQMLETRVREYLMRDVATQMDHVQMDVLTFATAEEANTYLVRLNAGEPFDVLTEEAGANSEDSVSATTVAWTPQKELGERWGTVVAQLAFALPVGSYSQVTATEEGQYLILLVTGHEEREASQSLLSSREQALYTQWTEGLREQATIETLDYWRKRVPTTPVIDFRALIPTATTAAAQ